MLVASGLIAALGTAAAAIVDRIIIRMIGVALRACRHLPPCLHPITASRPPLVSMKEDVLAHRLVFQRVMRCTIAEGAPIEPTASKNATTGMLHQRRGLSWWTTTQDGLVIVRQSGPMRAMNVMDKVCGLKQQCGHYKIMMRKITRAN